MRDRMKYVLKLILRFVLRIFWLIPIKKDQVFFMSTMGKSFSCNPKYLYISMSEDNRFRDYKYIWAFNDPYIASDQFKNKDNIKLISKKRYVQYFYYLLTSGIVIYNCGGFSYAPMRENQFVIETWHGGGAFKKVGISVKTKSQASKKGMKIASSEIKLFLISSDIWLEMFVKESMNYFGAILKSGMPRNDILFCHNEQIKLELKKKLGIPDDVRMILYAPTFKGEEHRANNINEQYEVINPQIVKKVCEDKFNSQWLFYTRGHQYANSINLEASDGDLTSYPDMQELLLIADILITDYSSSMWDFALTRKLCLLYVPDLEEYKNNERGFHTPIESWPGLIAKNNDELQHVILDYSYNSYKEKIDRYLDNCGSYEEGNACKQVKEYILTCR